MNEWAAYHRRRWTQPRAPGARPPSPRAVRGSVDAARSAFAQWGYDRATVRRIATRASVDPAMVHYFFSFSTKSRLFAEAMEFPLDPSERVATALEGGLDGLGYRVVRQCLSAWEEGGSIRPFLALMRSAPTDDQSAGMLREFVQQELIAPLAAAIDAEDADLRAELADSHLIDLLVARYVLRVEPLASVDRDTVAAWAGPAIQRYLVDPAPRTTDHDQ